MCAHCGWPQIKLSECRRVVLFTLDSESGEVDMRHYVINASPVGLTRSVKKIVKAKIPDLHRFNDISEFVLGYVHQHSILDCQTALPNAPLLTIP